MKPFDLKEAFDGKKIITRGGFRATFIGCDNYLEDDFPVVAKICHAPGFETVYFFTKDGLYNYSEKFSRLDLMMAEENDKEVEFEKKKGQEK